MRFVRFVSEKETWWVPYRLGLRLYYDAEVSASLFDFTDGEVAEVMSGRNPSSEALTGHMRLPAGQHDVVFVRGQ